MSLFGLFAATTSGIATLIAGIRDSINNPTYSYNKDTKYNYEDGVYSRWDYKTNKRIYYDIETKKEILYRINENNGHTCIYNAEYFDKIFDTYYDIIDEKNYDNYLRDISEKEIIENNKERRNQAILNNESVYCGYENQYYVFNQKDELYRDIKLKFGIGLFWYDNSLNYREHSHILKEYNIKHNDEYYKKILTDEIERMKFFICEYYNRSEKEYNNEIFIKIKEGKI